MCIITFEKLWKQGLITVYIYKWGGKNWSDIAHSHIEIITFCNMDQCIFSSEQNSS